MVGRVEHCDTTTCHGRRREAGGPFFAVSRLLSEPVYTAGDERLLNEAGDSAALAITKIVSDQEMNSPETGRRILLILHLAFETPQSMIGRNNKTPNVALRLLDQFRADGIRGSFGSGQVPHADGLVVTR